LFPLKKEVNWMHAFFTVSIGWLVFSLLGAIPLYFSSHFLSFIDAWFESMSGFATTGLTLAQVRQRLQSRLLQGALEAAVNKLIAEKQLSRRSELFSLPSHQAAIPPQEVALWERIQPILDEAGIRPPTVRELASELDMRPDQIQKFLDRSARRGLLQSVSKNRYFTLNALHQLGVMARELSEENAEGLFNAAAFRDRSGIGRNLTIELLEHFDKVKLTKRQGDLRSVIHPVESIFPTSTES